MKMTKRRNASFRIYWKKYNSQAYIISVIRWQSNLEINLLAEISSIFTRKSVKTIISMDNSMYIYKTEIVSHRAPYARGSQECEMHSQIVELAANDNIMA